MGSGGLGRGLGELLILYYLLRFVFNLWNLGVWGGARGSGGPGRDPGGIISIIICGFWGGVWSLGVWGGVWGFGAGSGRVVFIICCVACCV